MRTLTTINNLPLEDIMTTYLRSCARYTTRNNLGELTIPHPIIKRFFPHADATDEICVDIYYNSCGLFGINLNPESKLKLKRTTLNEFTLTSNALYKCGIIESHYEVMPHKNASDYVEFEEDPDKPMQHEITDPNNFTLILSNTD